MIQLRQRGITVLEISICFVLIVLLVLAIIFIVKKSNQPQESPQTTSNQTDTKTPPTTGGSTNAETGALKELLASFVRIPAGEFMMGSAAGDASEKPVHRVRISQDFEMGKYEVTQAEWQAVMGSNPSGYRGLNLPVENVSWNDAQEFIQTLNARDDKYVYRLPTEAEWEYACRAGSTGEYAGKLDGMAWYDKNSGNQTHSVGTKQANAWGLYDMHGNVWEWCQDWYSENYYAQSPSDDPQGPDTGTYRVLRGGSWYFSAAHCRSALRITGGWPATRNLNLGFRLVRTSR